MKEKNEIKNFFKIFGILILSVLVIFITYISVFVSVPISMKEYKLENNNKEIIFQEMVHIGETSFYKDVEERLKNYRKEGYIYAYEQVKVSNINEAEDLADLTGLGVDMYDMISKSAGLDNQKNHMGHIKESDINADISAAELILLIKKYKTDNPHIENMEMNVDIKDSLNSLKESGDFTKVIIKAAIRGMLKITLESEENMAEGLLNDVILKERDQVMFDIISNIDSDKIVIHYGALHFKGFFEKLKETDSSWKIVKEIEIEAF